MSELRRAVEQAVVQGDMSALASAIHPDVVYRNPMRQEPYLGLSETLKVLGVVLPMLQDFRYFQQIKDGDHEVLRFAARAGEHEIEGVDIVRYDASGLAAEVTVMIRPVTALAAVGETVSAAIAAAVN